MGLGGLEPPTSRLSGVRSNQLSYGPTGRASVGGSARRPGHSLPQPELPECCVSQRREKPRRPFGSADCAASAPSSRKRDYEQRTDSKTRKFDLEAASAVIPKDLPTGVSP